jgi:recombination protein RecT
MSTTVTEAKQADAKELTIRDRLRSQAMISELGKAMPKHCTPERMARVALTALTRTPKLAECTQASFFKCLLDLSAWGLEPDGRRAHLIPYGTECTLVIDYKGLVELAYRSGVVANIHADVVHEGDIFEYSIGEVLQHVPHFLRRDAAKPKDEGPVYAAYCKVRLKDGTAKSEVMSRAEVEGIRARSKAGAKGPWVTDWSEMAKKTIFRRLSKWLPLSAEIQDGRTIQDIDDDRIVDGSISHPHPTIADGTSAIDALTQRLTHADETPEPVLEAEAVQEEKPSPPNNKEYLRLFTALQVSNIDAIQRTMNDEIKGNPLITDAQCSKLWAAGEVRLKQLTK